VDFEKIPDLVAKRHVYLRKGKAYLAASDQIGFIVNEFKARLMRTLEALPRMDEDERLVPVLNNMSKQTTAREYNAKRAAAGAVNAETVDNHVAHFPLCMRNLHNQLRRDEHLRHGGRLQYGLFLKVPAGIGLPLDEALLFWKRMFAKTTDDKFQKEYAYNIRHSYGMEGKRTDYTPFRYDFFELTRPKPATDAWDNGSHPPFETITHPNQYFDQSYRAAHSAG
ncbi:MAG: eukaryotic and archaeal DNA primase, large subunit-domain-containing protein, partial [Olpidium bornovanus]